VEVPRIITNWPGVVTPQAGTAACASMFPTATGVPARNPIRLAIGAVKPPALLPSGHNSVASFSVTTLANNGCSPKKNSVPGYV
jgi:hypothetical protein